MAVEQWSIRQVAQLVTSLGAAECWESYARIIVKEDVDGVTFAHITVEQLIKLGFKEIHAQALIRIRDVKLKEAPQQTQKSSPNTQKPSPNPTPSPPPKTSPPPKPSAPTNSSPPPKTSPTTNPPRASTSTTAPENGPAVGIDLGTCYSCVAHFKGNLVVVIANDQTNRTTPSFVSFTDLGPIAGEEARGQSSVNSQNTIFNTKRIIGRNIDHPIVQQVAQSSPFKIARGSGDKPMFEVVFAGERKKYSPEEITAMILGKMRQVAENYIERAVIRAVITVPAHFTLGQRQATRSAAAIAGIQVLQIINEPSAAALGYAVQTRDLKKERIIMVVDIGGGSCDASMMSIDDGVFEVVATAGDPCLGGEDFDSRVIDFFLKEFKKKHNIDISGNARAVRRLRKACERAKRALSSTTIAQVEVDSLHPGVDFVTTLTRSRFEELCEDLFDRVLVPVGKVLQDSQKEKKKIDSVLLTGGSSRIPKVQQLLREFFDGKPVQLPTNPEEIVAYGAAVQAGLLSGIKPDFDLLLIDVLPHSLGVEAEGGKMTKIVERNSTLPCLKYFLVTTCVDGQTAVTIHIFEGERQHTKDNTKLGTLVLEGIAPAPKGEPKIELTFSLSVYETVVSAQDMKSNKKVKLTLFSQGEEASYPVGPIREHGQPATTDEDKQPKAKEQIKPEAKQRGSIPGNSPPPQRASPQPTPQPQPQSAPRGSFKDEKSSNISILKDILNQR